MLAQWSTSWLCSLKTCFTKSSIFEIGLAIFPFHHERKGFLNLANCPSVYSCPREHWPKIHAHVTSVSTSLCCRPIFACVDGGIRGSQVPRCFLFDLLSFPFATFFVCGGQFHTVDGEHDELVLVNRCTFHFPSSHSIFFTCPARSNFCPTHFHDGAISTDASILRDFLDHFASFLFARNATISYLSI